MDSEWTLTISDGYGKGVGGDDVSGVKWGSRDCPEDIKYGMERMFIPSVGGGYPPLLRDIIQCHGRRRCG